MNIKQKLYLITLIERMYPSWYGYKHKPACDLSDVPEDYRDAFRLADVSIKDECNIAQFEGACEVLDLVPVQDTKKWELRVETKKGKVLIRYNGEESNYDLDKLAMECVIKYPKEYQ